MPRLFEEPDSIPGLTWPTMTFRTSSPSSSAATAATWCCSSSAAATPRATSSPGCPSSEILFAGDLVESQAALYTGDAFHFDWAPARSTGSRRSAPRQLIGGRGAVARGRDEVDAAVEQTRDFLLMMRHRRQRPPRGGTLKEAFEATHAALAPKYGKWPIFEHCLPFDVPAAVGRDRRHRAAGHLDRRARPRGLGRAAGLTGDDHTDPVLVVVIGCGPVGQTTALLLARWGLSVVVLDGRPERDMVGSKAICQQRDVLDVWDVRRCRRRDRPPRRHLDDRPHLPPRPRAVQLPVRRPRAVAVPAVRQHLAVRDRAAARRARSPPSR